MASYRSAPTVPAEVITYRLGTKYVYVKPADDYEQALNFAQKEFPDELGAVPRESITFNVHANVHGEKRSVRISESAWAAAIARLLRGDVVDIQVRGVRTPSPCLEKDQPPMYLEVPQCTETKSSRRSPSPMPSQKSQKGSRSWFGRH